MTRFGHAARRAPLRGWIKALSLGGLVLCGLASTAQAAPAALVKTGAGLFQPASAPAKRWADEQLNASAVREANGWALLLQRPGAEPMRLPLPEELVQVTHLQRQGDRLVVTGWMNSALATAVVLVDWAQGSIVDQFWGYEVSVSPDASSIAFVRFHPSHFVQGEESQYRLYRTAWSAEANRRDVPAALVRQGAVSRERDAGAAVFPLAAEERWRPNVQVPANQAHRHQSPLVWSADSQRLAFIDLQGGVARLVVVTVGAGNRAARTATQVLSRTDRLCLPSLGGTGCPGVAVEAVRLRFVGDAVDIQVAPGGKALASAARQLPLAELQPLAP